MTDHHALIPTEQLPQYNKLNSDEHRIYTLIAERFVGLFAAPHKERQEKIVFVFGKEHFKLTQTKVILVRSISSDLTNFSMISARVAGVPKL